MPSHNTYRLTWVSLTLDVGYLFMAPPAKCSHCSLPFDRILKEELPRSVGAQYATGDQWRNNSGKNEGMEPKQKQYPVVDVTGDRSKVQCCKEQYCIGTWNVKAMNHGKLEVVKQKMARVNVDILGIKEINGLEWVNLTQMTIISTTVGRNPLEEME